LVYITLVFNRIHSNSYNGTTGKKFASNWVYIDIYIKVAAYESVRTPSGML